MAENQQSSVYEKEVKSGLDSSCHSVTASASCRSEFKPSSKNYSKRSSLNEDDFLSLLHGSDPVKIELNHLQNELRDKDRELVEAQNEIKALRLTERGKEKALVEVRETLGKVVEKYQASEVALESKNLEIKRITDEKKDALAAKFAAEATLRRVHSAPKDEGLPPLEAVVSILEAETKLLKQEISKLQDDNKTLERLMKSKEAALMGAERDIQNATFKASLVDDLQNRNQELMKQIEISQEEYKILDKMHRQKIAEVEKLSQTVHELEEAAISGAAAANAVCDYQRQVSELKVQKKTLERTLSRAKVTENRVAVQIAHESKDANDKFMPVKQWLEERRLMMGEMQQLRDKLAIAERAVRSESQFKEKLQLRLKVIEGALRALPHSKVRTSEFRSSYSRVLSNVAAMRKSPAPLVRSLSLSSPTSMMMKHVKGASKSFDDSRSFDEEQCDIKAFGNDEKCMGNEVDGLSMDNGTEVDEKQECTDGKQSGPAADVAYEFVSGAFYDLIQKEVIALRKACHEKDQNLKDKDNAIEVLTKKIDTLTKVMGIESKQMQREKTAMEKEVASMRIDKKHEQKRSKGIANNLYLSSGRNSRTM